MMVRGWGTWAGLWGRAGRGRRLRTGDDACWDLVLEHEGEVMVAEEDVKLELYLIPGHDLSPDTDSCFLRRSFLLHDQEVPTTVHPKGA